MMAHCLDSTLLNISLVPTDVTFLIKDSGTQVAAHKTILGMASPVFSKMLFGSLKEVRDVIPVEHTTAMSFSAMSDFIYGRNINCSDIEDIEEIFAVANMAERYEVVALTCEVKKKFARFKFSTDNVVEIAATAQDFVQFEDLSIDVNLQCAKYLKQVLLSVEDFVSFANKHKDSPHSHVALELMSLTKDIPVNLLLRDLPIVHSVNCEYKAAQVETLVTEWEKKFKLLFMLNSVFKDKDLAVSVLVTNAMSLDIAFRSESSRKFIINFELPADFPIVAPKLSVFATSSSMDITGHRKVLTDKQSDLAPGMADSEIIKKVLHIIKKLCKNDTKEIRRRHRRSNLEVEEDV